MCEGGGRSTHGSAPHGCAAPTCTASLSQDGGPAERSGLPYDPRAGAFSLAIVPLNDARGSPTQPLRPSPRSPAAQQPRSLLQVARTATLRRGRPLVGGVRRANRPGPLGSPPDEHSVNDPSTSTSSRGDPHHIPLFHLFSPTQLSGPDL